mmetsp:Transcript_30964/g.36130  ORF Transcript_30964/g.36130 Transcript_30964/m.36130 type:complete len:492 (+) Transcript_30964:202-1677(+)
MIGNTTTRLQHRNSSSRKKSISLPCLQQVLLLFLTFLTGCFLTSTVILHTHSSLSDEEHISRATHASSSSSSSTVSVPAIIPSSSSSSSSSSNHPTLLQDKRILVAIASFDFSQFPLLEEVLDSYQDLCFAGSKVDIYIHTTVPYTVALIDLLNSRLSCDNLKVIISVQSPALRLNLVDCHRTLFYEMIDVYDLFIYSEDDILVKPSTVATYLKETIKVEQLVGKSPADDFNIGIVRYEYNYPPDVIINDKTRHATQNVTRVYWEHLWTPLVPKSLDKAPQSIVEDHYVTMQNAHQGMFLATRELLKAWKDRPNCQFDVIRQRPGRRNQPSQPTEGTQRVWMSSRMLHGGKHCNVQQLIPMKNFGQMTVWHLPNKNYRRVGKKGRLGGGGVENEFATGDEKFDLPDASLPTAMQMHLELRKAFPKVKSVSEGKEYNGIVMINDIDTQRIFKRFKQHMEMVDGRMKSYEDYVSRGGQLSDVDFESWRWVPVN